MMAISDLPNIKEELLNVPDMAKLAQQGDCRIRPASCCCTARCASAPSAAS
jgi:hypothetical protein